MIKQHDSTDCAAACLAMMCLYYKKETSIAKLRDLMGTDLKGTNLVGLNKCAETLGFTSQPVRVNAEGLSSKFTLPSIVNIITDDGLSHFVVVFKITKNKMIIADPAKGIQKISIGEFRKNFTGIMVILKPNSDFIKGKSEKKSGYFKFISLLTPHKTLFLYSILSSVILTILGIASSTFNKILMDEILPYKLKNTLVIMLCIFSVIAITQVIIDYIRKWMMLYLSQKIDIPLMLGYFEHIYNLPMKFFSTRKTGDIITRFSDAFTIKDIFTNIALTLIIDISMAIITGILLFNKNLMLFTIIMGITVVNIVLVFIFKQPYKKINEEQMQKSSTLNSQIIESLRGIESIKGNVNEENELENIEKDYISSLRTSFKVGMLSNVQGAISGIVSTMGNLILMYFGIIQVINNDITIGDMMSFMTLSGYFMDPLGRLVSLQLQIQEANISMKRIMEIFEYSTEEYEYSDSKYQKLENINTVEFKDVTFKYGNRKHCLKNISFSIKEGKKIALVGGSGSGKSTVAKLLLKYYTPENGEILINGVDINEISNRNIRKIISYVPQSIELFSRTIWDNIKISKSNATLDEIKEAAKAADAHDFIRKLPLQYNTYLEEAGNGLSGGEKQRIALARAFLKKNNFYILDESTSNLDFATENIIFDMIYNKFKHKSMLIIAHRLATIKNCDEIIVINDGEIIERGSHEELIAKEGTYNSLWEMQQGNFVSDNIENDALSKFDEGLEVQNEDEICYV